MYKLPLSAGEENDSSLTSFKSPNFHRIYYSTELKVTRPRTEHRPSLTELFLSRTEKSAGNPGWRRLDIEVLLHGTRMNVPEVSRSRVRNRVVAIW